MIQETCQKYEVELTVLSDGWSLLLTKDTTVRRVVGLNFDLNSQAAAAAAKDKVATTAMLAASGIPHISHALLNPNNASPDMAALELMVRKSDVVMKPIEGGKGTLVKRVTSQMAAELLLEEYPLVTWALSQWNDILQEVRIVVVDDQVRLAYEKTHPVIENGLKFFNLSKGAKAEPLRPVDARIASLAVQASRSLGLRTAAVDIVKTAQGETKVLEVNAAYSLTRYAQMNDANYKEVASFYDRLISEMFAKERSVE